MAVSGTDKPIVSTLRRRAGVEFHILDDEGVIFDCEAQRLFHLNSMATYIWCHLGHGMTEEEIAVATARAMRIRLREARQYVTGILQQWRDIGLLEGGVANPAVGAGELEELPPPLNGGLSFAVTSSACRRLRHYRFLTQVFSVGFPDNAVEEVVHPVLQHLEVPRPTTAPVMLYLARSGGLYRLLHDGKALASCAALYSVAPLVLGYIGFLSLRKQTYLMALHAGGVVSAGRALLLPAHRGGGKSVLTAALIDAGWQYLSDDTVLLDRIALDAIAVPYSLGIKHGAWEVLTSRHPGLSRAATHLRHDGELVRYITPPPSCKPGRRRPVPVGWIVYPVYVASAATDLTRLSPMQSLDRLLQHCCAIPRALSSHDIKHLICWIAGMASFELRFSALDPAIVELEHLAAAPAETSRQRRRTPKPFARLPNQQSTHAF